jgi:hypothetical protein
MMKRLLYALLLAVGVGSLVTVEAQTAPDDPNSLTAIRVLSPKAGEKVTQSFLKVTYELAAPVAADTDPRFELRLDTRDPERVRDTEHTFTGLAPGPHTLSIQLIDANDRPVPGARAEVEFLVVQPKSRDEEGRKPYMAVGAARRVLLAGADLSQRDELPAASSPLPLLSLIGFGVLLGGIAAGTRSR